MINAMDENTVLLNDVLKAFENYTFEIISQNSSGDLIIRANLSTAEEAEDIFKNVSLSTNTQWIIHYKNYAPKRCVYSTIKVCHFNEKFKIESSSRNAQCNAKFSIHIKKLTVNTKKRDPFMKLNPPLCAEIKLTLQHSHPVNCAVALRMLRVSEEVKNKFFSYFGDGMTPSQAMSFHENKLLSEGDPEILANAAFNPTKRQVYTLHNSWRSENMGSYHNPFEKLKEKINLYKDKGTLIKLNEMDMKRDTSDASLQAYKPRPGVGVGVIVISKKHPGCVIIGKRKGKIGDGLFQLPGGHLEFGESWEDAACREVCEETGIHITNVVFCHVVNSVVPDIDYHYVTIFMKGEVSNCGPTEPENKEPDKCEGWQWTKWEDMPEENLLFYPFKDFRASKVDPFKV